MGLFDKVFNKKNEEPKKDGNLIMSMPMFASEKGYCLNNVIKDLQSHWGRIVEGVEGDDQTATFSIDGELVALALMPAPIPSEEFESMYEYSYLWKDAETEIKNHKTHAIVSLFSGDAPSVKRYSILTMVNASILRTSENAIGVYQGESTLLLPKKLYVDFADMLKEEMLPIQLWVYVGIINDGEKCSLYTYGMKEFDKLEMEIIDSNVSASELYDFFMSVLHYILQGDITLKDGETIGLTEEQKIKIVESKAVYLDGTSLKLEM